MADKVFDNWDGLVKHLKEQINEVLENEMAKQVKDEIQTAISEVVYIKKPKRYIRRGGNKYGGMGNPDDTESLADRKKMHSELIKDGVLKVVNNAERNPDYDFEGFGYDTEKSLAENIIEGYGSKSEWYNQPRPFMKRAVENMKEANSHLDTMKKGLEKRLGKGTVV